MTDFSQEIQSIYFEAMHRAALQPGQSTRMLCPYCEGGNSNEVKCMAVYRIHDITHHPDGLFFKCYRASCGKRGFVGVGVEQDVVIPSGKQVFASTAGESGYGGYTGGTDVVSHEEVAKWFQDYPAITKEALTFFGCRKPFGKLRDEGKLVFNLYPYLHSSEVGGHHIRVPWSGDQKLTYWAPKHKGKGSGSWYNAKVPGDDAAEKWRADLPKFVGTKTPNVCVVVEDVLSAIAVGRFLPTYCMLGTHMSEEASISIATKMDAAVLWTDPDTWQAVPGQTMLPVVKIARALASGVVVVMRKLDKDPKYLTEKEIMDMLEEDYGVALDATVEVFDNCEPI